MTTGYGCLGCDGKNPVNWLITRLNPGSTTSCCDQDIDAALLAMLATRLEVDAGWLSEAIDAAIDVVNPPQEELDAQPDDGDQEPLLDGDGVGPDDPEADRE